MRVRSILAVVGSVVACAACSSSWNGGASSDMPLTDDQYRDQAATGMHDALVTDIVSMTDAAMALQDAAPMPPDSGWDATRDAQAIAAMKDAWIKARAAYEHVEGALAPLFPDIDFSIDARYDDFMTKLEAQGGDQDLFDGLGVTGMHAIERILYADQIPARVVTFEAALPGYVPASFPQTVMQASEFKNGLCAKFVSDAQALHDQWTPASIDVAIAFQGLISLMNEQREKVEKASSNEEESRYSQRTMVDLRDNLSGTRAIYALFQPWIRSKTSSDPTKDGKAIDTRIVQGFQELDVAYAAVSGDEIPEPPATWSAESPSADDLASPFGQLFTKVTHATDPTSTDSVVAQMNDAAAVLGFPEFQTGP